ncbi:MAG: DNA repair protein RecO [Candidatus Pacebacteria bacterium]|nr:DNA repair protein RecO [Candidatus Paceibacterota bacterium]
MYEIYNTEGIVLSSGDVGEANKFIYIFSEQFGLISATAQSVRQIKSKLRFGLQKFTISNFSLVRGKDIWRITNIEYKQNLYYEFYKDKNKLKTMISILVLIKKLLAGEKYNERLYKIIRRSISFLKKSSLSKEEISDFENIVLIRVLHNLGYFNEEKKIQGKDIYKKIINTSSWDKKLLQEIRNFNGEIIKDINESLYNTHLF